MIGSRITVPLGLALAVALAGCGSTAPYSTAPAKSVQRALGLLDEDAAEPRRNGPVALAFCYNNQVNSPEELLVEARLSCPKGDLAYYGSDILWTPCSLFQPSRATFVCTPKPSPEATAAQ